MCLRSTPSLVHCFCVLNHLSLSAVAKHGGGKKVPFLLLQISSSPTSKYTTYHFDPDNPKASFRLWYFRVWFVVDFLLNCWNKMHPCFVLTGCACFMWRANFNIFKLCCCRWHFHMFLNKAEVILCLRGGKDEHFLRQKRSLFVLYYFCQTADLKVGRRLKSVPTLHSAVDSLHLPHLTSNSQT